MNCGKCFDVTFVLDNTFNTTFAECNEFEVSFGKIQYVHTADPYPGEYVITPTIEGEILPTRNYYMADDLTIKPIPYYETTNLATGKTAIIGGI